MQFDLQMFAELDIAGIDEDILKEMEADNAPAEDVQEEPKEEPKEEPATEPAPTVEADNVNKQVEEQKGEDEDVPEGNTIPYDRFKSVNERRKNAESRIKELEEELKRYREGQQTANATDAPKQERTEQTLYDYSAEQRQEIARMAIKRAKEKLNLTDEDIEAMEYSDDPAAKALYNNAVLNETNAIHREIQQYKSQQEANKTMLESTAAEFQTLNSKLQAYDDAQERWRFISDEQFNKLSKRKQTVINDAFLRLQKRQGTYQDIETVADYFDTCNKIYDNNHGVKPKNNTEKISQAQRLPTAPSIGGASGGDRPLTAERVAEILNSADGWDNLSEAERKAILAGQF